MGDALFGETPTPPTPGPPPMPVEGGPEQRKRQRKYREPAQVFKDEELRLGLKGKLGM